MTSQHVLSVTPLPVAEYPNEDLIFTFIATTFLDASILHPPLVSSSLVYLYMINK